MEENQLLQFKLSEKLIDWYNAIYWTLKIDKQSTSPLDYGKNQEIDVEFSRKRKSEVASFGRVKKLSLSFEF